MPKRPSRIDLLELDIDLRLADLWREAAEPEEFERRRHELAVERDRALAALKELEFDHRTGKVSDEDYRTLVGPLRRRAAEALRALEPRTREAEAEGRVHAPG